LAQNQISCHAYKSFIEIAGEQGRALDRFSSVSKQSNLNAEQLKPGNKPE